MADQYNPVVEENTQPVKLYNPVVEETTTAEDLQRNAAEEQEINKHQGDYDYIIFSALIVLAVIIIRGFNKKVRLI